MKTNSRTSPPGGEKGFIELKKDSCQAVFCCVPEAAYWAPSFTPQKIFAEELFRKFFAEDAQVSASSK